VSFHNKKDVIDYSLEEDEEDPKRMRS